MKRLFVGIGIALIAAVGLSAPASAHVTVSPSEAAQGGYATLTFKIPSEEANANTTKVEINVPADANFKSARVQPVAGWDYAIEGSPVTKITWTATTGGLKPTEFTQFLVALGPLPNDKTSIDFPVLQTYSNGDVARWIEATPASGEEPEHPVPSLTLTPAAGAEDAHGGAHSTSTTMASSSEDEDGDSNAGVVLGIIGIAVGALGLAMGAVALRKKSAA